MRLFLSPLFLAINCLEQPGCSTRRRMAPTSSSPLCCTTSGNSACKRIRCLPPRRAITDTTIKLPKVSLADEKRRNAAQRKFLARLESIKRDALTPANQLNYDIFARVLREHVREFEFQTYLMPVSDRWGFHIEFPELPRNMPLTTTRDYENYIARLGGFADYAAGHIELMREGIRRSMTLPSVIMQRYNEPLEAQIVDDPEKSLLYGPLKKFPQSVPENDQERLQAAARKAIAESVVPGYRRFLKFMKDEYVPNCRGTIAASALPNGRDYYRFCVGKFTTLDDRTPEEIHAIGKAEVARIRGEMDKIIREVKFDGDFAKFTEYLRTDPKFYAKTPEELEKEVSLHSQANGWPVAHAVRPLAANAVRHPPGARLHRAANNVRVLPRADRRRPPGRVLLHQHVQTAEPAAVHARSAIAARSGARPSSADRAPDRNSPTCPSFASTPASPRTSKAGACMPKGLVWKPVSTRTRTATSAGSRWKSGGPAGWSSTRAFIIRVGRASGRSNTCGRTRPCRCTTSARKSIATSAGRARRWPTRWAR